MIESLFVGVNLFDKILDQIQEQDQRRHEQKLKELSIISDSNLRSQLAMELLMDKILSSIEESQFQIQEAAKYAQYMAEVLGYYYADHGLNEEQANQLSFQFRLMAIQLTEANYLADLKLIYKAITLFLNEISHFKHKERKYSIEYGIRQEILNKLNTCITNYNNFQRRTLASMDSDSPNVTEGFIP
ncbi:hypothetical protein [Picosynechococcus sp. PCC 73109]|uniref:hypothetical protein n=1 Tax=Picosynechococcus sp. PCC 73109 TaxID=374982 RepID=UPI0007459006|nr:hypothetical protein [Picosynechococcus sp. PCC 73109]AMA08726.1 hypothetical protein AWQ23_05005 [Picosynechococcus sp. PCC 73109]